MVVGMRTHHRAQLGGQRGASRRNATARALHLVMANLDVTDAELADLLQTSRQTVNSRRKGRVSMTAEDLAEVAEALGVDVSILLGPPHQAVQWLIDNQRDRLDALEPPGVRHGGDGRGRSLSQKNGLLYLARQHNAWSYKLGVSATAA